MVIPRPPFFTGDLAFLCQITAPYRINTWLVGGYNDYAWSDCRFARTTCAAFNTHELPREEAARGRQKAAAAAKKGKGKAAQGTKDGPRSRPFNLRTYKLHALGDYFKTIRLFGTTDNYSTQVV